MARSALDNLRACNETNARVVGMGRTTRSIRGLGSAREERSSKMRPAILELTIPAEDEKIAIEVAEAYAERVGWPSVGVFDMEPAGFDAVTSLPAWRVTLERE